MSAALRFGPLMSSTSKPIYAAFDLVWLNGKDLSNLSLLERKKRLCGIVSAGASRALYVDHIVEYGKALFAEVCKRDMEWIVAKLAKSPYKSALNLDAGCARENTMPMLCQVRRASSSIAGASSLGNAIDRLAFTSAAFADRGPKRPTAKRPNSAARSGGNVRNTNQNN
jgi:ATP dependent DNA ligase domain